jgi:hypothetical protein
MKRNFVNIILGLIICAFIFYINRNPIARIFQSRTPVIDSSITTNGLSNNYKNISTSKLISLFTKDLQIMSSTDTTSAETELDSIYDELLLRKPVPPLIALYDTTKDYFSRGYIRDVLYHIDDTLIYNYMMRNLNNSCTEENYYVAMYLAKKGYAKALEILNNYYWKWPVSSWQFSYTAELFGKYKYYPAADNLIESLNAASFNLADGAIDALQNLYPGSKKDFSSPDEARKYFLKQKRNFKN